jgi:molybdopterin synthase sulfur carrier subunit
MIRLVFLGKFGDVAPAGLSEITLPAQVKKLSDIWGWIGGQHPALGKAMAATKTRIVHNQAVAHDLSVSVADGDEIAFLPPMSGG